MPKPSKQIIIDSIIREIDSGKPRGKVLANIGNTWQISQRTFDRHWKTANDIQKKRQQLANKVADDTYIQTKGEAVKKGLKSKTAKQIHLQKCIDEIQKDIDRAISEEYIFEDGVYTLHENIMTAQTKAYLRKTIKELYSELNKMEGDYAPAKTELSGKLETDNVIITVLNI